MKKVCIAFLLLAILFADKRAVFCILLHFR
jgi:hypothetical protein